MAESLTKHQGSFFAFLTDKDRRLSSKLLSVRFHSTELHQLCDSIEVDFELYGDLETLSAAGTRIAELVASIPGDHVVLVSVG